jgi:hypothetical protein
MKTAEESDYRVAPDSDDDEEDGHNTCAVDGQRVPNIHMVPPGWDECRDAISGDHFFLHRVCGTVQWSFPQPSLSLPMNISEGKRTLDEDETHPLTGVGQRDAVARVRGDKKKRDLTRRASLLWNLHLSR